jgi:hypothetical protein
MEAMLAAALNVGRIDIELDCERPAPLTEIETTELLSVGS